MDIVFFGTSEFAAPSLENILSSRHKVLIVITQPDKRKGRYLKVSMPPVKELAIKNKLKVWQPEKLDSKFKKELRTLKPDLSVVIAYGEILKKEILDIPLIYTINAHPSLLPEYRGAAPINWAIINGEAKTGVTIIKMNEKMDEGDIISQREIDIESEDTALTLSKKLAELGSGLLLKTIDDIENKKEGFRMQDRKGATYARKLVKEDGLIEWKDGAVDIHNKVRGLIPWPAAYTIYKSNIKNPAKGEARQRRQILKIWKTEVLSGETGKAGEIIKAEGDELIIGTGKDLLRILELQLEGGKRMDAESFLRGHKITIGDRIGATQ